MHTLRTLRVVLVVLVSLGPPAGRAEAQSVFPKGRARVVGTVVDSATGRPIVRTRICRYVELTPSRERGIICASPDTTGRYVFDSLPGGTQILTATCSRTPRSLYATTLAVDTLMVADGEEARFDIRSTASDCDMRPFIVRSGVFEGYYSYGFESSTFGACKDSISAWVELSRAAIRSGPKWPEPNDRYNPTYFVRWRGTLQGPWQFGHLGVSKYEFRVDSILEIRRARRRSDCQ